MSFGTVKLILHKTRLRKRKPGRRIFKSNICVRSFSEKGPIFKADLIRLKTCISDIPSQYYQAT